MLANSKIDFGEARPAATLIQAGLADPKIPIEIRGNRAPHERLVFAVGGVSTPGGARGSCSIGQRFYRPADGARCVRKEAQVRLTDGGPRRQERYMTQTPHSRAPGLRARLLAMASSVAFSVYVGASLTPAPATAAYARNTMSFEKWAANEPEFSSREDAEDFLARTLPLATAGNPRYVSKADKVQTVWLTKSIGFGDGPPGHGIQVSTDEEYTETRAGVPATGTHQAVFSLGDVSVSMETSDADSTEAGEPARGIIFRCAAPGCIKAKWGGQPSLSDWTDIYLQDATLRARILAAFEFLKSIGQKSPS